MPGQHLLFNVDFIHIMYNMYIYIYNIYTCIDVDIDMDIDSDMAVSINRGFSKRGFSLGLLSTGLGLT